MENIDEKLLSGDFSEATAAKLLREEKVLPAPFIPAEISDDANEDVGDDEKIGIIDALKRATAAGNFKSAVSSGAKLGLGLRRQISETNFDSGTFYTVLFLSLTKDFLDFSDLVFLGMAGPFINIVITLALFIVFFLRGSFIKRYLLKRFLWPAILSVVVEFIPFVCDFPTYTVMTIFLKMKMDKERRGLEEELAVLQKEMKRLEKIEVE